MPARKRRVAIVTGSRAEYGLLKSTIDAIRAHPRLTLQLIVVGMHMLRRFGRTVSDIERDAVPIAARVPMQRGDDSNLDQARGLARGVAGIAVKLETLRSDVVLVLGDRIEAMAGALAATTTGRWLAHVHGGDLAEGDIDESLRHAITKLAQLHFPATPSSARRIAQMGEPFMSVHCVGATGLDRIRELTVNGELVRVGSGRPPLRPYSADAPRIGEALIIQHAYGRSAAQEERIARLVLDSVATRGLRRRIMFPNSDRGCSGVIRAIERHARESNPRDVMVQRSLPRDEFIKAAWCSAFIIGNSSAGIIEAPFLGVPSINVGERQRGRERGGPTVLDAKETAQSIRSAIRQALATPRPIVPPLASTEYGDGSAGRRIAAVLAGAAFEESVRRKRFVTHVEMQARLARGADQATYRRFRIRNRSRRLSCPR